MSKLEALDAKQLYNIPSDYLQLMLKADPENIVLLRDLFARFWQNDLRHLALDVKRLVADKEIDRENVLDFVQRYTFRRLATKIARYAYELNIAQSEALTSSLLTLRISSQLQVHSGNEFARNIRGFCYQSASTFSYTVNGLLYCPDHFGFWEDGRDLPEMQVVLDLLKGKSLAEVNIGSLKHAQYVTIQFASCLENRVVLPKYFANKNLPDTQIYHSPFSIGLLREIASVVARDMVKGLVNL